MLKSNRAARLAEQLGTMILQLFIVTFFVFLLVDLGPGDPAVAIAGDSASQSEIDQVREQMGLNRNVVARYGDWLWSALHGDMQRSLISNEGVSSALIRSIPPTLSLVLIAVFIAVVSAFVLSTLAALRPGGLFDKAAVLFTSLGAAIPGFWIALVLVSMFATTRAWFPAVGYTPFGEDPVEWFRHLILPALAISVVTTAELTRQLRSSLLQTMGSQFVIAARAKGVRQMRVVLVHAMKNAAVPALSVLGVKTSQLIGMTVVIESIFNIPGIGKLMVKSTITRDIPVVVGVGVFTAIIVILVQMSVEALHPVLNPKVRAQ